jgi:hypothetical protein
MTTCDNCDKKIERVAYCSVKCKMSAWRKKHGRVVTLKLQYRTEPLEDLSTSFNPQPKGSK